MMRPPWALLPLVLALLLGADGADVQRMMGDARLAQGRWRMAAQAYREALELDPDSGRAKKGLARAQAGMGRCHDALETFEEVRYNRAFSASDALAEAVCHLRTGDAASAQLALDFAVEVDPDDPSVHVQRALLFAREGQSAEAWSEVDALYLMEEGALYGLFGELLVAHELGRPGVDALLAQLDDALVGDPRSRRRFGPTMHLVDGLRWLEVGDPRSAMGSVFKVIRADLDNARAIALRLEAMRRLSGAADAELIFERPGLQLMDLPPLVAAIQARVLVDQGELEAAAEKLAAHPDPSDPDALASRWYLARARGDREAMARAERAWRRVSHHGSLEQLIPIHEQE